MIRQVRLKEVFTDAQGNVAKRESPVFAFGTHPQVMSADEAHPVTAAQATGNKLRIIMDELLVGNYLEEIACRGQVDEDSYDTVRVGTNPDDIARCAVGRDILKDSCPPDFAKATCICKLDEGCGEVAKGDPVGVLDVNQDGAADNTRMQVGAVGLRCGSVDVPMDLDASYWNPSGDQNVPAKGGFDALGPAIVLVPALPPGAPMGAMAFLPTNAECKLIFAPSVVDKQGEQVCAPPNGDVTQACTPGNVDAFTFKVEPLTVLPVSLAEGNTGISRTSPFRLSFSAPLDPASVANITVSQGNMPYTQFTVTADNNEAVIKWTGSGLAANTQYTVNVPTSVTDFYGQPLPMPSSFTFTTGM